MSRIILTIAAAGTLAIVGATAAPAAQAASSLPGFEVYAAPDRAARKTTRKRSASSVERRTTRTGQNGRTATREMRRDVDRDNQSVRTQRSATGPNGRSATSDATLQRTEDGFTRDMVATGPNGRTATSNTTQQRTEDGFTRNTTATGPNGRTATRDTDVSYDPETGLSRERVTTGPNGGVTTRSDNAQWDPDTQTWTRQGNRVTADGREQSVDVTARRTETGATRTATRTRADGSEVTRNQEIVREGSDD